MSLFFISTERGALAQCMLQTKFVFHCLLVGSSGTGTQVGSSGKGTLVGCSGPQSNELTPCRGTTELVQHFRL
jgi:hypothetical protein